MTDPHRSRPRAAYQARAEALLAVLRDDFAVPRAERTIVAVAGESGSGKSVTAIDLAAVLNDTGVPTALMHQDNYFVRPPRTNHEFRLRDICSVGPQEVQLDLMQLHMRAFRACGTVTAPIVNYPANRFDVHTLDFSAARVLVVEGTYALLLEEWDVGVFLEATYLDTEARRKARNRDIDDPFVDQVLAIEHGIISSQAARADILLDKDFEISRQR